MFQVRVCTRAVPAASTHRVIAVAGAVVVGLSATGLSAGIPDSARVAQDEQTPAGAYSGVEHRWIVLARRYREAVRVGDVERVRIMQAPNARVWFDEKKGEGRPLDVHGKGPWAQWDNFFRARSSQTNFVVEGNAVRFTNHETNDWFRLIERTSLPYYIFYFFDENDRISGKLIQRIESVERPPDRLSEFQRWANDTYPGLMDELMPDGNIDPDLEKARLWKKRLLEWRAETGLPDVLDDRD